MSVLAEPRRKQRISVDPQNLGWKNDMQGFGKRMLEKMGWSAGKGLGRMEQGPRENLKLVVNCTKEGLGCKHACADKWVEHHNDFAALLTNLNKMRSTNEEDAVPRQSQSLEKKSKLSKARIHYHKSTRGKDLSHCSEQEKAVVLGSFKSLKAKRSKRGSQSLLNTLTEHKMEMDKLNGLQRTVSVEDYFAEKLMKRSELLNVEKSRED